MHSTNKGVFPFLGFDSILQYFFPIFIISEYVTILMLFPPLVKVLLHLVKFSFLYTLLQWIVLLFILI